jgi:nitrite reductase (NO-forming)
MEVPGTYVLVDHSIFRAFNKGALGMMKAEGEQAKEIYSGKEVDSVYVAEKSGSSEPIAKAAEAAEAGKLTKAGQIEAGKALFLGTCSTCHQMEGQGIPKVFPPLAKSDYLMADKKRSIEVLLNGLSGKVVVNGQEYASVMPPMSHMADDELANILTYVRNAFGNSGDAVSVQEVTQVRNSTKRAPGAGH